MGRSPGAVIAAVIILSSPIAALCAFLIAYEEYSHHFATRRQPLRLALRAAAFALIVFVVLGLAAGLWLSR